MIEEISGISKRFLDVIQRKGYSNYKISQEVDVFTEAKLSHIKNGRNQPSDELIDALLVKFPDVNKVWLLTGDGEMLIGDMKNQSQLSPAGVTGKQFKKALTDVNPDISAAAKEMGIEPDKLLSVFKKAKVPATLLQLAHDKLGVTVAGITTNKPEGIVRALTPKSNQIPVYNDGAAASAIELYNDESSNQEPSFYVSIPQFADCDFGKMIFGHSMYPTYENGSYAFMRRVNNARQVAPGEVYYIETKDLKVVKRLQYGSGGFNDDHFIAFSDNDEKRSDGGLKYEPFPIFKEDILALFLVKGAIKQNQN